MGISTPTRVEGCLKRAVSPCKPRSADAIKAVDSLRTPVGSLGHHKPDRILILSLPALTSRGIVGRTSILRWRRDERRTT